MILPGLILWLLIGGLLAWFAGRWGTLWPRVVSLVALFTHLAVLVAYWIDHFALGTQQGMWLTTFNHPWISELHIRFYLGMDGLSLLMLLLVDFLGIMAVAASWVGIQERVGFFHFNLLWIEAALAGAFMALDLFLFYFFWEMMLVPLYFLIGIWGHENRVYATLKFFIFTQASSLLMLLAILALYFFHGHNTGVYTFDYTQLIGTSMSSMTAFWLMMGFFAAFGVKLAVVPVHSWLPDAHTEAPTAGSVDLAGLVLKVGAYGMIRFMIPLFPKATHNFTNAAMVLGLAGIFYGAILAFAQLDLKRLVAYTSISHMGFVLIGIFAWNQLALQGAVMIMLAHGISTGALFVLVGALQDRMHCRDLDCMGGLWSVVPNMGKVGTIFAAASLGLPGMGNFVGEFLVLLGVYRVNHTVAVAAALGFIVATIYTLWMLQRIFGGPNVHGWELPDLDRRETAMMVAMIVVIFWLGIYPHAVLSTSRRSLENLDHYVSQYAESNPKTNQAAPTVLVEPGQGMEAIP
jgi:NADH-quinone oxidoreductase subunit M